MKRAVSRLILTGLLLCASGLRSDGQNQRFAYLTQATGGPLRPYFFDNGPNVFGVVDTDSTRPGIQLDVNFQFQVPVPVIGTRVIPAQLSISASADGTMFGSTQPLNHLLFEIKAKNPADVVGSGILLRRGIPDPLSFPGGTSAELSSAGNVTTLQSEFLLGLVMESDYVTIDPTRDQNALWTFSTLNPAGSLAPGAEGYLRDTQFNGSASFNATLLPYAPPISGKITFEGIVSTAGATLVEFECRPVNGDPPFTRTVSVPANGAFTVSGVVAGSYNVAIKGARYLRKVVPVNTSSGPVSGVAATLRSGDANGDNSVDVLDLDKLILAFDASPSDGNWNPNADFNGDNSVDVLDLDLLIRNFDAVGDD